jgi:hypothetical protein
MRKDALRDICTIVIPNKETMTLKPKESLVQELVSTPDNLALLDAALDIAGAHGTVSKDTSDLAQLTLEATEVIPMRGKKEVKKS